VEIIAYGVAGCPLDGTPHGYGKYWTRAFDVGRVPSISSTVVEKVGTETDLDRGWEGAKGTEYLRQVNGLYSLSALK